METTTLLCPNPSMCYNEMCLKELTVQCLDSVLSRQEIIKMLIKMHGCAGNSALLFIYIVVVVVVVCLFWHSSAAYKLIVLFSLVLLSLAAILMYLLCVCVRSALISKICAST